jgi:hypothetical protein
LVIAITFLVHGFYNLLSPENLPVDLALRYWQTKQLIFDQINIYSEQVHAQYPPSFFAFLSPLFGYVSYQTADWVWAMINVGGLIIISTYLRFHATPFKWVLPLSFLAFHSIAHGLGVGQVHVFIIANLIVFIWIYELDNTTVWLKFIGVAALSISLGKYSLSIPFALVFLISKKHRLAAIIALLSNVMVSFFVLQRVGSTIPAYITTILKNASAVQNLGTLDIQALSQILGLSSSVSLFMMVALLIGFVIILLKVKIDLWTQLALAALTARFYIYHAHYDNVIFVFLIIALWKRIPQFETLSKELILYGLVVISLIIPARFLEWHAPYYGIFLIYQLVVWLYSGYLLLKNKPIEVIEKSLFKSKV